MQPGPKPQPRHLKAVPNRRGADGEKPAHDPLPPADLAEPDWSKLLPNDEETAADAAAEWNRIVPVLTKAGRLSAVDRSVVIDYCVCHARVLSCERAISMRGVAVRGRAGAAQKNPATTVANQYRTVLKFYVSELGLAPASRVRLPSGGGDDGEDDAIFDS